MGLRVQEFVLQCGELLIIQRELELEGPIGHPPAPLHHGDRLVENVLKGHRPPSLSLDEACSRRCGNGKSRPGAYIPHTVEKRKQEWGACYGAKTAPGRLAHPLDA